MVDSATEKTFMKSPENLTPKGVTKFSADSAGTSALPGRREVPVERKKEKEPVPPKKGGHALRNTALILTGVATGAAGVMSTDSHLTNKTPLDARAILVDDVYHGIPETAQKYWRGIIGLFGFQTTPEAATAPQPTPVDKAFPYTLDASSFVPITQEQAVEKMKETNMADIENYTIKMFLPFDKETLDASPNLKYDQVQKAVIPSYLDEALRKKLEGVKNSTQIDGVPDGAPVYATESGKLRVSSIAGQKKENEAGSYTPAYSMARIDFVDSTGKPASIIISVLGGIPLFDPTQAGWDSNGIDVQVGQPLFTISKDNAIGGQIVPGQKGQTTINAFYIQENPPISSPYFPVPKLSIPLKIDFLNEVIVE